MRPIAGAHLTTPLELAGRQRHRPRWLAAALCLVAGCAAKPAPVAAPPPPPSYEQKIAAILHLEDRRVLTDAALAPPSPTDLPSLLGDNEGRIRRRAALGIGRAGLLEGVAPLSALLAKDSEPEVRAMAAFALGLIVQGRAAEGLGLIGHRAAADTIAGMAAAHVRTGVLAAVASHDETYPQSPAVEAVRLAVYALVRLEALEPLRAVVLGADGAQASDWWPFAYAVQRLANPAGAAPLRVWLTRGGATTRAFAARGLGLIKDAASRPQLEALAGDERQALGVRVQAVRALASIADRRSAPVVGALLADKTPAALRLEAVTAFGAVADAVAADVLVDYLEAPWPPLRAAAQAALAKADPDTFMTVLSGIDIDDQWSVRAALASTLGGFSPDLAAARLEQLVRDPEVKVRAAALAAMARLKVPSAGAHLLAALADPDPALRSRAAQGLSTVKPAGAAEALRRAYEASRADTTYIARGALLGALAAVDPTTPLLRDALADPDWAIRVRAATLLTETDRATPATPTRPAPAPAESVVDAVQALAAPVYSPQAYVRTSRGEIRIALAVLDAPRTVASFVSLVGRGFFNGLAWHRIVPDFVVQSGDPRGDGEGGPGYTIRDELNDRPYLRGTVGMALDWKDTGGSQFFITHSPQPHLDARYSAFGTVVAGMDVVEQLLPGDTIFDVRVWDGAAWIGAAARE
jgi:cyclophilin family peptidyl-prolyl cis-trans isomerase/HEAT repeat protein